MPYIKEQVLKIRAVWSPGKQLRKLLLMDRYILCLYRASRAWLPGWRPPRACRRWPWPGAAAQRSPAACTSPLYCRTAWKECIEIKSKVVHIQCSPRHSHCELFLACEYFLSKSFAFHTLCRRKLALSSKALQEWPEMKNTRQPAGAGSSILVTISCLSKV